MVVEGGWGLSEDTPVRELPKAEEAPSEAKPAEGGSLARCRRRGKIAPGPKPPHAAGRRAAVFRPDDAGDPALDGRGDRLDAPDAQRHLSRGRFPPDRGDRPVAGLAVKDVEVASRGRSKRRSSIVLGVQRVRSKSVRGAAEMSIDFAPGPT